MIEIYFKNNEIKKYKSIDEIEYLPNNIFSIRFIDFINSDLEIISEKFDLDLTSFSKREDIEISSHYMESTDQLSLNFTIPSYSSRNFFKGKDIHILVKNDIVFTFLSPEIEDSLNQLTQFIYSFENTRFDTYDELFIFQIGVISDYYADIVELISKKINDLFQKTLKSKQFKENDLEQNKIFKILTIITVCISLPTLIVGIYGMNFKYMPELKWVLGCPIIVLFLILSFVFPLIYFKRKKWF